MSVVLVTSLIIIYMVSDRARHESFQGTLRSEAITKANLFLEKKVNAKTMQHIYLNNTQFINEVEVAVYTSDFQMLYHDAAEHDIVKETPEMIRQIGEKGEMEIEVEKGYQAVGILYRPSPGPFLPGRGVDTKPLTEHSIGEVISPRPERKGMGEGPGESFIITAAAHDGYGEANMIALRNTLLIIFLASIVLMTIVGYVLATLTIRPIERALTAQKMFASNVSHELRTPLAAIMGELGLALQKERTPEDYQNRISRALDDTSRMSDTIIGLLNLARAEYDASQIKMESIRIDELLMDVAEGLLRAKSDYHINIAFVDEPESDETVSVMANRYLLDLAFRNLMENNCKYSYNHTSTVTIRTTDELSVTFEDSGIGMSDAEKQNIFNMFYRGDNKREAGHGIGMALVQRIMSLHKSKIEVHSKEGHGTKFVVRLTA